jgi:hypothetical protein
MMITIKNISFLTSDLPATDLQATIPTFQKLLRDLKVSVRQSNKQYTIRLNKTEVRSITKFFYKKLFSTTISKRIKALITYMIKHTSSNDLYTTERAL